MPGTTTGYNCLLPYVMEFNMDSNRKYWDMAIAGNDVNGLSRTGLAKCGEPMDLTRDLNIKSPLKEMNISERELDEIVESASKVTRLLDNNPKKLSSEDIKMIYKKIL